jgi:hypothetical protein
MKYGDKCPECKSDSLDHDLCNIGKWLVCNECGYQAPCETLAAQELPETAQPITKNELGECMEEIVRVKLLLSMAVDEIDNAVDNGWVLVDDFEFYVPSKKILGKP